MVNIGSKQASQIGVGNRNSVQTISPGRAIERHSNTYQLTPKRGTVMLSSIPVPRLNGQLFVLHLSDRLAPWVTLHAPLNVGACWFAATVPAGLTACRHYRPFNACREPTRTGQGNAGLDPGSGFRDQPTCGAASVRARRRGGCVGSAE
jgi:hypothetical protein